MNNKINKYLILFAAAMLTLAACKKTWSQRDSVTDPQLNMNLLQQLQANTSLSTFAALVVKTGYDKVLASSKTYTVWAPTNTAMQAVDPAIIADTAKLKQFVGNHIVNQTYLTSAPQPSLRIRTLNGKNITFTATQVEDANITTANIYVNNGIMHIIDKALIPKYNIWEYINNLSTVGLVQKAYLQSQNYTIIDTTKATVVSVDPVTGKPILKPGTGVVNKNYYFDGVVDLSNEDKQYTYIVLTDAALSGEMAKISKYLTTSTTDSTTNLSKFYVLKDLAFNTVYTTANLTDTIVSTLGVKAPFNKANIVSTYNASNGIVYVMSAVPFRVQDKIAPIVIQGENPSFFARTDRAANIFYRTKKDANGVNFNDLLITGTGGSTLTALFYAGYKVPNVYSCKFNVSWRAVNDLTTTAWTQQLAINSSTAATFPYTSVTYLNYAEVALGTYTTTKFGPLTLYAIGANAAPAAVGGSGTVTIDYIKLVPVLQ